MPRTLSVYNYDDVYPAFSSLGHTVVFFLLLDRENVSKPFKQIAWNARIGVHTVRKVIRALELLGYIKTEGRKRKMASMCRLLQIWTETHHFREKKNWICTRLTFNDEEARKNWRSINLPFGMLWGGEAAIARHNASFEPDKFVMYSMIGVNELLEKAPLHFHPEGEIVVYRRFWRGHPNGSYVPHLLLYAGLSVSRKPECREIAKQIFIKHLKYLND